MKQLLRQWAKQHWHRTPMLISMIAFLLGNLMSWPPQVTSLISTIVWWMFRTPFATLKACEGKAGHGTTVLAAWQQIQFRGAISFAYFGIALFIRFGERNQLDRYASIGSLSREQRADLIEQSYSTPGGYLLIGLFLYALFFRRHERFIHHRGNELHSFHETEERSQRRRDRGQGNGPEPGIEWAGMTLPKESLERHFMVCGVTGSGKTTVIDIYLQSLFRQFRKQPMRMVVFDAKTEMVPKLLAMPITGSVAILNPFDQRGCAWDIAKDAVDSATIHQFASIFVPSGDNESQPFFPDSARILFAGVMRAFAAKAPGQWTLRDCLLACESPHILRTVLELDPSTARIVASFFNPPQTLQNILSTLQSRLIPLEPIASAWSHAKQKISLVEWTKSQQVLVLGQDDSRNTAMLAINRLLVQRIAELLLSNQKASGKTFLVLDEARTLGKVERLDALMIRGRSLGVAVLVGLQEIEGYRHVLGEKIAHEILSQCSVKTFLRCDSVQTAEWASKSFGEQERWEYTISESFGKNSQTTRSEALVKREVVLPSEIQKLPLGNWQQGIHGYTITPDLGSFQTYMSPSYIHHFATPRNRATPAIIPRPKEQLELAPWTDADLKRLGLPADLYRPVRKPNVRRNLHPR